MRSYAFLIAGALATAVSAQSASGTAPSLPNPTGIDPAQSSIAAAINDCLEKCDVTDTRCQAQCVAVPSPNEDQIGDLISCSTDCDQGDGSEEDTNAFSQCLARCRDQHYFSAGEGTPNPTGSSGNNNADTTGPNGNTATPTGSAASPSGSGESDSNGSSSNDDEASGTGSAEQSEESGDSDENAAPLLVSSFSMGLFGVFAAFFL